MKKVSFLLCVLSMVVLLQYSLSRVLAITCIAKEREALLQFKKSFEDPSHRLASWNGINCCNWYGVGCNQTTAHVTKIDLRHNWLDFHSTLFSNSIDSSLFELKYLNYLDLSGNYFNNTQIPNFLGSMVELTYLNLSTPFLVARVLPHHLGNLTKLVALDLSGFDSHSISDIKLEQFNHDVEWISHLSSLQSLALSGADLSKASNLMQRLSSLPLLSSLVLRYCSLQKNQLSLGSMNSSFLSRIQHLDLSFNNFNGPIPMAFSNMTSLKFLYLSNNMFTTIEGGLSSFIIGSNCFLKVLDLSYNYDFGGDVFGSYENESMGCSQYDLQVLKLRDTSMKTKIPDWLGRLKNLQSLSLSNSSIYGSIPTSLGNLTNLEDLDISNNALTGAIPTSFGKLMNLKLLDISGNLFKCVLTEAHFTNLSSLNTLEIGYNELLSFNMKSNWVPVFQLEYFDASSCIGCFGSEFPQWLQTQKALVGLVLSNTSISSALPTWLRAQNLTYLDLSHNQIVGPIPMSIGDQMPNLEVLYLNDNLINDSLPPSLCKLKNLFEVDFSNNGFSGMIQGCLLTSNLILLDLSSNNFSGTFAYSHENISHIRCLKLRNNNFEGSMPIVLKNFKDMKFLDLEGNNFSGNIPTWLGNNLKDLIFLRLRGNLFNGTIPSSLCNLIYLRNLDLAHNQLEGSIPQNLSNFIGMASETYDRFPLNSLPGNVIQPFKSNNFNYSMERIMFIVNIDLSQNYLVGSIPSEITMLKDLLGLNLSHNNLTGIIPAEIGEIESLESLDLSFNQLSGPIPRSISRLSSLGVLKLSHNNLSGDIPREGHLSTFNEASSFYDNPNLCGDPLPKKCAPENPFELPLRNMDNEDKEEDKWEKWLLYIMIILGYAVGFWGVVGVLILKRSWRYAYFKFADETKDKIHATIQWSIETMKGFCIHK